MAGCLEDAPAPVVGLEGHARNGVAVGLDPAGHARSLGLAPLLERAQRLGGGPPPARAPARGGAAGPPLWRATSIRRSRAASGSSTYARAWARFGFIHTSQPARCT